MDGSGASGRVGLGKWAGAAAAEAVGVAAARGGRDGAEEDRGEEEPRKKGGCRVV